MDGVKEPEMILVTRRLGEDGMGLMRECGGEVRDEEEVLWVASCTRYFPKSYLDVTFQMVINRTNPGLWSVFHIEALWKGKILLRYSHIQISK